MTTLHPDLLLLAALAQAYELGASADNLYALAQYGTHAPPPMTAADMQVGLSLLGLDSYRVLAPGLTVPDMLQHPLSCGRVVLAQVRGAPLRKTEYWIALCDVSDEGWHGIAVGISYEQIGIAAHLGHSLTGFYLVCERPLPSWEALQDPE
jgi:hypothetical protein